jgi:hypothetical protein
MHGFLRFRHGGQRSMDVITVGTKGWHRYVSSPPPQADRYGNTLRAIQWDQLFSFGFLKMGTVEQGSPYMTDAQTG